MGVKVNKYWLRCWCMYKSKRKNDYWKEKKWKIFILSHELGRQFTGSNFIIYLNSVNSTDNSQQNCKGCGCVRERKKAFKPKYKVHWRIWIERTIIWSWSENWRYRHKVLWKCSRSTFVLSFFFSRMKTQYISRNILHGMNGVNISCLNGSENGAAAVLMSHSYDEVQNK